MNQTLPSCHLRPVCDRNDQMIHTWTAPDHGNTICDSQSTHKQIEVITTQHSLKHVKLA